MTAHHTQASTVVPAAVLAAGPESREVDFLLVHERLTPILEQAALLGEIPILGSTRWAEIPLDDVRWRHSVVAAGYRWALAEWLRQDAESEATKQLSGSANWSVVASRMRGRADYLAANPWARRSA